MLLGHDLFVKGRFSSAAIAGGRIAPAMQRGHATLSHSFPVAELFRISLLLQVPEQAPRRRAGAPRR